MTRLASVVSVLIALGACGGDDSAAGDTDGPGTEESTGDSGATSLGSGETSMSTTGSGSTGGTTDPTDPSESTGETGEEPPCEGIGFDVEASVWALPDLSALPLEVSDPMQVTADNWGCSNEEDLRYTTMDLTGDGQVDFVITDGCDASGVGAQRWIVHPGEDGGFGAATTWGLPELGALPLEVSDPMQVTADNWGCSNEEDFRYTLMDLTGDGRVDFVITDGCDASGVGAQRWIVHPGEDGGFGAATTWGLPDLGALPLEVSDPVQVTADNWGCTNEEDFRYAVMDLTGDGRVDFVITDGCDAGDVGAERWIVHPGEDGGFGAATAWGLPDLAALPLEVSDPMQVTADNWGCTNEEDFRYTLMDLTADGRVDFVITDGCDAGGVGAQRWIVHPGEDGGFGAALTWGLPDLGALPLELSDPMQAIADSWGCTNEEDFRYTLTDLAGDGRVDFVITDGCDASGVGAQRWIVHPGEDGGFGAATTWSLPDLSALPLEVSDPMQVMADSWGCTNEEDLRYTTTDLDGDGLLDIVLTDGCDAAGVGAERWITHPTVCE